jgi:hypothetical protein
MNKRVLISWSGGLDSTYLIQHYLDLGYHVDVVNCDFKNAYASQMKREQAAMKKMMKGYFRNKNVTLVGTSHIHCEGHCFATLNLTQPPVWLFNLVNYLRAEHTEVAIGYVMNDDAVSFLDVITNIWNSYAGLLGIPLPPLVFPLIKRKKTSLYYELNDELKKHITWCENPEKEDRCGKCPSCKKMLDLGLPLIPYVYNPRAKLMAVEEPPMDLNLCEEETRC